MEHDQQKLVICMQCFDLFGNRPRHLGLNRPTPRKVNEKKKKRKLLGERERERETRSEGIEQEG